MKYILIVCMAFFAEGCTSISQPVGMSFKKTMPKKLKEISGIVMQGNDLWAISDRPHPLIFRLNPEGKLTQEVKLKDVTVSDVEAITSDGTFLYIGDVGDNDGSRDSRKIYKVALSAIPGNDKAEVPAETIEFTFDEKKEDGKKKDKDYDCEAILTYNNSIFLFTKRRSDDQSQLYVLPNSPGKYQAKYVSTYNTEGMVTDAAINKNNSQVVLTGYNKGHDHTFVLLLSNFKGEDFFSGDKKKISLLKKKTEWQIEGVTYKNDHVVYISCEETKDIPATLYAFDLGKIGSIDPGDIK